MRSLIRLGTPKYIRVYDAGEEVVDCITIVFTGRYRKHTDDQYLHLGLSRRGIGFNQMGHSDVPIDKSKWGYPVNYGVTCHLGLRVGFDSLTPEAQKAVLERYCDLWDIDYESALEEWRENYEYLETV